MIFLLEYLCHSTLAVIQISQNNNALLQYLDEMLSYHLCFSFLISTFTVLSWKYFWFPFWYTQAAYQFQLLPISKSPQTTSE